MIKRTFESFTNKISDDFFNSAIKFHDKIVKYYTKNEPKNKLELFDLQKELVNLKKSIEVRSKSNVDLCISRVKNIISTIR